MADRARSVKGTLFDIQHFAVHDGDGIRTLVFLKGCPLACKWCCNPESQSRRPELRFHALRCKAAQRCVQVCPSHSIAVTAEGLRIDRYHCRTCLNWVCIEACPESALVRVGSEMTVEAVLQRVAKDRDFYRNSGGGVTFSGGEPYSQAPFLLALLRGCRELGVPTAVETCGFARGEDILETVPLVDLFLFDLKAMDPERSKALTGQDNALILKNLAMLAQRCPDSIVVRVALIPGATDDNPNIEAIAQFMLHHGLNRVHLEPYHTLGIEKYAGLGRSDAWEADPCDLTRERIQEIGRVFETQGIRWEVP